jgi:hypothetical protein
VESLAARVDPMPPDFASLLPPDLRRRAHARLAERIDPARVRHKPLSLLRQEARRALDQFLDAECVISNRAERDRLAEDLLAEAAGCGPLEELFRDEAVREILALAPAQVICRRNDAWLPTSARFRDAEQYLAVLSRFAETGEPCVPGSAPAGGFDVRLGNGFHLMAILPPAVMGQAPLALFVRGAAARPSAGSVIISAPQAAPSGVVPVPSGVVPAPSGHRSGARPGLPAAPPRATTDSDTLPVIDPAARLRQRLTERIITKFAAAGMYDLNQIPLPELRKIVLAHVQEFCHVERLGYDAARQEMIALEILAGMNR